MDGNNNHDIVYVDWEQTIFKNRFASENARLSDEEAPSDAWSTCELTIQEAKSHASRPTDSWTGACENGARYCQPASGWLRR